MEMDGGNSFAVAASVPPKNKKALADFGDMGDLLSKIENKIEK